MEKPSQEEINRYEHSRGKKKGERKLSRTVVSGYAQNLPGNLKERRRDVQGQRLGREERRWVALGYPARSQNERARLGKCGSREQFI